MTSESFMTDFLDFINHSFEGDYVLSRDSKLSTVLEKCYEFVEFDQQHGFDKVVAYIEANKRCKLPWTSRELETAKMTVLKLLASKRAEL